MHGSTLQPSLLWLEPRVEKRVRIDELRCEIRLVDDPQLFVLGIANKLYVQQEFDDFVLEVLELLLRRLVEESQEVVVEYVEEELSMTMFGS